MLTRNFIFHVNLLSPSLLLPLLYFFDYHNQIADLLRFTKGSVYITSLFIKPLLNLVKHLSIFVQLKVYFIYGKQRERRKKNQINISVPESWNTGRDTFVFVCVYTMLSNGCSVSCKTIHTIGKIMVKIEV